MWLNLFLVGDGTGFTVQNPSSISRFPYNIFITQKVSPIIIYIFFSLTYLSFCKYYITSSCSLLFLTPIIIISSSFSFLPTQNLKSVKNINI